MLRLRLRSLCRRKAVERELDAELRFHLDKQIEENIGAGISAKEARDAALRQFGDLAQRQDECRDARKVSMVEDLLYDLRYGGRTLRQSPVFAAVAVLSLALGIGANTAIFTLINAVLLKTLPVPNPQQLMMLKRSNLNRDQMRSFPYPFYRELRDRGAVFTGVLCKTGMTPSLTVGGSAERISGELVSGKLF